MLLLRIYQFLIIDYMVALVKLGSLSILVQ